MTPFTDPLAAIEEAGFMAMQTGYAHAVISAADGYDVIPRFKAHGMEILETVHEVDSDA